MQSLGNFLSKFQSERNQLYHLLGEVYFVLNRVKDKGNVSPTLIVPLSNILNILKYLD